MGKPETVVEVLIAARELISVPERWTKGAYARDADGSALTEFQAASDTAVCWCGLGAVYSFDHEKLGRAFLVRGLLNDAAREHYPTWQDAPERTHAEVLAAFDKAIELARAEEA